MSKTRFLFLIILLGFILYLSYPHLHIRQSLDSAHLSLSISQSWSIDQSANPILIHSNSSLSPSSRIEIYTQPYLSSLEDYVSYLASQSLTPKDSSQLTTTFSGVPMIIETGSFNSAPYISYYFKHPALGQVYTVTFGSDFVPRPRLIKSLMGSLHFSP